MDLAAKLQLEPGARVALLGLPKDCALELPGAVIVAEPELADAVIAFITGRDQFDAVARPSLVAALDDRVAWIAYPKAGRLGTDLNRDSLAALVIEQGGRPVRQVAIDDTWSALRFRPGR